MFQNEWFHREYFIDGVVPLLLSSLQVFIGFARKYTIEVMNGINDE